MSSIYLAVSLYREKKPDIKVQTGNPCITPLLLSNHKLTSNKNLPRTVGFQPTALRFTTQNHIGWHRSLRARWPNLQCPFVAEIMRSTVGCALPMLFIEYQIPPLLRTVGFQPTTLCFTTQNHSRIGYSINKSLKKSPADKKPTGDRYILISKTSVCA